MRFAKLLVGLLFMTTSLVTRADIAVITHMDNPLHTLAPADIKRIYLKQTQKFPDGRTVVVATLPTDLALTRNFYQTVLKMSTGQWHTYWAQYQFNGQKSAPQKLTDQRAMRQWVAQTPGALGFVQVDWVDDSVKVLRTLSIEPSNATKNRIATEKTRVAPD